MKSLTYIIFAAIISVALFTGACESNNTWELYEEWRLTNDDFYNDQTALKDADGSLFYKQLTPSWYPSSGVLIHYFNDRSKTEGNLSPLVTSTVDVKYIGRLYNDEPFDSSYANTANGDSIFRFQPSQTITGWQIALSDMRVGDSARVVIPYGQGYEAQTTGSIPPYSTLVFDIKLVDIYRYELAN